MRTKNEFMSLAGQIETGTSEQAINQQKKDMLLLEALIDIRDILNEALKKPKSQLEVILDKG